MSDGQVVQLERRAAQRFDFHLPVSFRPADSKHEGCGFTQNLSARGVFFYSDCPLQEGSSVELTLVMPSQITLVENMGVRCRARVMRVTPMTSKALHEHTHDEKTRARPESRGAAAR